MRNTEDRRLKLFRGTWCVVWRENGRTKRASLRTKDRGQAERNLQEYLRQTARDGSTVAEILDLWAEEKKALKSIKTAKNRIPGLKAFFGNYHPDQITKALCLKYANSRKVSNTSIRNELAILRCAVRWNDKNTKAEIVLPSPDEPRDNFITIDQYKALVAACQSHHMRLFIILAWGTAARSGAILDLTWSQIDMVSKTINFGRGSGNKKRAITPMTSTVYEALKEAHKARTSDYVIEYGGEQVKRIIKGFRATAEKAGIYVRPHDIRRSAARHMVENGVDMNEVAQYLGHTNPLITYRVYARYSPTYLRKAASVLDQ